MTTILVIEDTHSLREEILQILDLMNFQGVDAPNGAIGIQLARQFLPDVIICDIMMPEMDGYDVLQILRRDPETAHIPFIFLTAKADRSDIRRGMNLGADDYLTKPFTSDDLGEAITARLYKQATVTLPYVAEMKRATQQLGQLAFQDTLTGLPNRILLQQRLQEALIQAKRDQQAIAVFCVELQPSRGVNIRFGQSAGDALLQAFAERLLSCVTPEDTVARLSDDEFCILLTHFNFSEATEAAERIFKTLSAPYSMQDQFMQIQISMGGTVYPNLDSADEKLLHHAMLAKNWSKKQGDPGCQFYSSEIAETTAARALLKTSLRDALDRLDLQVYYQPQVNLVTGRIIGAEALMRWRSPDGEFVDPSYFLSIAEETGLIVPMGEWLLQAACKQAKVWQITHLLPLRMAINLSAYQFKQPGLVRSIAQVLQETQLEADLLSLELSEVTLMEDVEASLLLLQQLKDLGVHIGIDDFGTGYSSLNYLSRLPVDVLKIDQTFVQNITIDENAAALASAITTLARSLNLRVVAEGVETQAQLDLLRRQGCNAIQGFLFSPAIPADRFESLLTQDKRLSL